MPVSALLPLLFVLFFFVYWIKHHKMNRLISVEEILPQIFPGESNGIEIYTLNDKADLLDSDRQFWKATGKWRGLLRKRRNAVCFVHLSQQFQPSSFQEKEEIYLIRTRALLITFFITCAIPEAFLRWLIPSIPRTCARVSAQLYWDLERRITTLCAISRPDVLDRLYQIL